MKEDNQEMAQMNEFKGTGTSVRHENGKTVFKYHNTDICSLDANTITLNSGGYHTSATKIHLNQISNQYGLVIGSHSVITIGSLTTTVKGSTSRTGWFYPVSPYTNK
jgi:hypothetical protein